MNDPYEWHTKALAGEHPPIHEDEVQCGWFCRRFETEYHGPKSRPPLLPARIFYEAVVDELTGERVADDKLACEVAGVRRDAIEEWLHLAGRPIPEAEYDLLMSQLFTEATYRGPQRTKAHWLQGEPTT